MISLRLFDRAAGVYRHLAVDHDRSDLANELAAVVMNRGTVLRDLGRPGDAVAAYDEAIAIRRGLVAGGRTELANGLASALMNRGNALRDLGRLAEAIAIRRGLVAGGRTELANDLAGALMNMAIILKEQGGIQALFVPVGKLPTGTNRAWIRVWSTCSRPSCMPYDTG